MLAGTLLLAGLLLAGCAHVRPGGSFDWDPGRLGKAAAGTRGGRPTTRLDTLALAALDSAGDRYGRAARRDPSTGYPRWAGRDGRWRTAPVAEWTSGFFPGTLWLLYRRTGDASLRSQAERWTAPLPAIFHTDYHHDLGFQFYTTAAAGYRLTGDERYRATALEAAKRLAARFDPRVGAIRSWNGMGPGRPFPVIADNMMNLELLFWGARNGGDAGWADIARRHAETTIANHLRPDGGSFHVVLFDTTTGRALERITHQGYADSTTWARGEAWLLYGFAMAYRETGRHDFLATAERVAAYFVGHLPADGVPCWDFQAPGCPPTPAGAAASATAQPAPRDAAAAAIAASGLLELSTLTGAAVARGYRAAAERILTSLASPAYLAPAGAESLVMHATGNRPAGTEVDVSLIYADYYFVEALTRYLTLRGL